MQKRAGTCFPGDLAWAAVKNVFYLAVWSIFLIKIFFLPFFMEKDIYPMQEKAAVFILVQISHIDRIHISYVVSG